MDFCIQHQFLYYVASPNFPFPYIFLHPAPPRVLNSSLTSQTVIQDHFSVLLLHYPEIAPLLVEPSLSTLNLTLTHFLKPGTMWYLLYPPCLTLGLAQTGNIAEIMNE